MSLRMTEQQFANYSAGKGFSSSSSLCGKKRKGVSKIAQAVKAGAISVHRAALIRLAKDPSLRSGEEEHYLQVEVFDRIHDFHPEIYPYLSSYPAGGMRSKKTASKMQAEGQKKGYPDIILDAPKGVYHGARFELKTETGTLQDTQKKILKLLSDQGYYCTAIKGAEEMVKAIVAYWNLEAGQELSQSKLDEKWLGLGENNQ
ncbi:MULTISPECIES: VRR-NUC domain-containing protein [Pseudoalteromonas]|uniref:VRR-NUC domain-containing protein n=1 Tax=Pseudoalteromonas TaxID=53246 RepID=UPI00110BD747|nr:MULTISPECIES: VRR-NUC domain-containing protein [Pseudoalteromonas]MCG7545373.1 VRR-NUC domain-containing protein [Pseudoalteromonas sp. MM17-2]TMO87651.1 norphogenetic protein [Pseudoalteromonas ruthenica]TMP22272.1 norphogenetic protein [Pseudoalteromonas ruthenica]